MKQEELRSGTNPKPLVDKSQYTKTKNWRWWWDHLTANGINEKCLCEHCNTIYEPIDGLGLWFNYGKLIQTGDTRSIIQTEPCGGDKGWCCSVSCLLDNVDYISLNKGKDYATILTEVCVSETNVPTVVISEGDDYRRYVLDMNSITKLVDLFGTHDEKVKYFNIQNYQAAFGPKWKNAVKVIEEWIETLPDK